MMKRIIILLSAITLFTAGFLIYHTNSYSRSSVQWHSFNSGLQKARNERKPVIIDFYADWCHWCKVMDQTTFADSKVIRSLNTDYIAVKVDTQSTERINYINRNLSSQELAIHFGIKGLPTVVFLDKSGEVITLLPGYIKAPTFSSLLDYIRDECYTKKISFKDYMEGKANCGDRR
ncbi:MAG TPA: DUF255 domain-containing protein [Spirochaetota bacterium]|nr:DUF255 domain-containing protein [Spirochaetota bacterium]